MKDIKDIKEWFWLVKTNKGDFFMTVVGDCTQEEAANKVWQTFARIKLDITAMIPRKRVTGPDDAKGTIYQHELGYSFLAGKNLWEACGRGLEYESELILSRKGELAGE